MPLASIGSFLRAVLQIAILAVIFLYVYGVIRGTRGEQMLRSVALIAVGLWGLAWALELDVLLFVFAKALTILAVALVVIFQPEIRQAFVSLGNRKRLRAAGSSASGALDAIISAADSMSRSKTGAIIAIERGTHLREWTEDATKIDAPVSRELLLAIFYPGAPLHDGGIVIKDGTIVAARCVFPLSRTELGRGTRHRAALGLSERADAAVVVVSEETGSISVACEGHFFKDLNRETLARLLGRLVRENGLLSLLARAAEENAKEAQP